MYIGIGIDRYDCTRLWQILMSRVAKSVLCVCLQMTNYVGQKDVENTLHIWMGAVLRLLAMDSEQRARETRVQRDLDMHRDPDMHRDLDRDLDCMLASLQSWAAEWQWVRSLC